MRNYKIKDAYFACTTPYQMIVASVIPMSEMFVADLYIFSMFRHYYVVAVFLV